MVSISPPTWPDQEFPITKQKRVLKELSQGQEFATQLQILLQNSSAENGSLSADELVVKILRSFSETLSILMSSGTCEMSSEAASRKRHVNSICSEESGESSRKTVLPVKDRRGCYKRRKTSDSWTVVSPTTEDDHAWRKYGQKEILNAKFPRSYFRCTRKYDQGCRAIKQVQRVMDHQNTDSNAEMYEITYIGHHTCRDVFKSPKTMASPNILNRRESSFIDVTSDLIKIQNTPQLEGYCKDDHSALSDLTDNVDLSSLETDDLWANYHLRVFDNEDAMSDISFHMVKPVDFDGNDFGF